jgi:hypothetical protein
MDKKPTFHRFRSQTLDQPQRNLGICANASSVAEAQRKEVKPSSDVIRTRQPDILTPKIHRHKKPPPYVSVRLRRLFLPHVAPHLSAAAFAFA